LSFVFKAELTITEDMDSLTAFPVSLYLLLYY